jgi:hypothetical protein
MYPSGNNNNNELPSARKIKRTCNKELYRTVKRLNTWIPAEQITKAEQFYYRKVILHLQWIAENGKQRKKLADWWEEHCCAEIAELWDVDQEKLAKAFRDAFGG